MKQIEISPGMALEQILKEAKAEDVVLTCQGHAIALLSDFDDEDLEWYQRERDPKFLASLAKARTQVKQGKTVRHEDLQRQLGID